mmetsp:Transcript_40317/g.89541  ORF Transcript_40317/g.89541 Transcript_40317/m.89541 type:complete len:211 (+) Transcript_40317:60-692(+)|eukprot:CAMPEP_0202893224 /NCGR_PEP_ID=MMETSP1392-20130828/2839_1 /ASSEMBLY_ACC=CAM_ASM_000868 /TAXON_ID=225041 /ORGANISM="Chlamydomonas chlamydogama, Strain SAG 11-48b" /LENGTH=210 /DNA_ID=CAMNT_0049577477 /DNA_START=54 /DNA_END=686 /DNA_ORIENTATION=-
MEVAALVRRNCILHPAPFRSRPYIPSRPYIKCQYARNQQSEATASTTYHRLNDQSCQTRTTEYQTDASRSPGPAPSFAYATIASAIAIAALGYCSAADAVVPLTELADLDVGATAKLAENILRPLFLFYTILYIVRIPMTWYPDIKGTEFPWNLAFGPTEPILSATRKVIPLVGGVDITPIVWVGLISFFNEILLGPQGILTLIERRGAL